jgi:hypothetical protein
MLEEGEWDGEDKTSIEMGAETKGVRKSPVEPAKRISPMVLLS